MKARIYGRLFFWRLIRLFWQDQLNLFLFLARKVCLFRRSWCIEYECVTSALMQIVRRLMCQRLLLWIFDWTLITLTCLFTYSLYFNFLKWQQCDWVSDFPSPCSICSHGNCSSSYYFPYTIPSLPPRPSILHSIFKDVSLRKRRKKWSSSYKLLVPFPMHPPPCVSKGLYNAWCSER